MTFDELTDVVALATITGSVALGVPYASGYISGCIQASKLGCLQNVQARRDEIKADSGEIPNWKSIYRAGVVQAYNHILE